MGLPLSYLEPAMPTRSAYLFLLPALLLYLAFVAIPILQIVYFSFFDWDNGIRGDFVFIDNFARLGGDWVFWAALGHNAIWVILTLAFPLMAGLLLAAILA